MENVVVYEGQQRRIVWAREASGMLRAKEFFDALPLRDRAKLQALFERMGEFGVLHNPEKFRNEGDGIYCFKSSDRRLPCFFDGRDVVVTHGFTKKKPKVPPVELQRAKRIRTEYLASRES